MRGGARETEPGSAFLCLRAERAEAQVGAILVLGQALARKLGQRQADGKIAGRVDEPLVYPARQPPDILRRDAVEFGCRCCGVQAGPKALAATGASGDLQIATAAIKPRVTCPAGRVWMPLHGGHGPMRLIDLDDVLPDPWRTARQQDERERRELAALTRKPDGTPVGKPDDPLSWDRR